MARASSGNRGRQSYSASGTSIAGTTPPSLQRAARRTPAARRDRDAATYPDVANLRAAQHGGESPALRLTRYFCNRGLEQPTATMRQLVLVVLSASERAAAKVLTGRACRALTRGNVRGSSLARSGCEALLRSSGGG